ncbi:MAG: hypothetical protein GY711_20055 [bacterium]|nr:hypothetical protein [bacterium]
MLFIVFIVISSVFTGFSWHSYRKERTRAAKGEGFSPRGAVRWETE